MKGDFSRTTFGRSRHYRKVLQQQGRVHVDADWNEAQDIDTYLRDAAAHDVVGLPGSPSLHAGFAIGINGLATDLTISAGRLFVDGVMCENEANVALSAQPDFPPAGGGLAGYAPPGASGRYLVYLDAWERYVSALVDPSIRETALGGPDTAGRAKLVWQVRLAPAGAAQSSDDFDAGWAPTDTTSTGTLFAQTDPAPAAGPCVLPPLAGYRALTNQLYRVEIHQGGWFGPPPTGYTGGTAPTFKWSRDNGTVVAAVTGISGQSITIAQLGPDVAASYVTGQWVELLDARSELTAQHGQLLLIGSVVPQTGTIVIDNATAIGAVDFSQPVLLRRWDNVGNAPQGLAVAPTASLEAGISVQFSQGGYRAGDYWTFPARTAIDAETGTIVWPGNGPLPPNGIRHHYAPLALVDYNAGNKTFSPVEDCRTVFDPLTGRLPLFRARWTRNGSPVALAPGQDLGLGALQGGISVGCSATLDAASITPGTVQLVADIPVTLGRLNGTADTTLVGTQPVNLACDVAMTGTKRFTVTPSAGAAALLQMALTSPQFSGSQRVQDTFAVLDMNASTAWSYTPEGYLKTQAQAASPFSVRSLALSKTSLDRPAAHAGMTLRPNTTTTMKAGIVFNYRAAYDFWVFYYANASFQIGYSGGYEDPQFGLVHFFDYQIDRTAYLYTPFSGGRQNVYATTVDLDVTPGATQLNFGFSATWNDGTSTQTQINFTGASGPPIPTQLAAGTLLGVFEEGTDATVFQRLEWTRSNEQVVRVLPAGGGGRIAARLVAHSSAIRSTDQTAQSSALALPVPRTPVPNFESHFWVVPDAGGYPPVVSPPVVTSGVVTSGIVTSGIITSGVVSSGPRGSYVAGAKTLGGGLL
jgi:hypothetical protein